MKKTVSFEAGEGRHFGGAVNFLISEDHAIYAECAVPDGASEDYGYLTMTRALRDRLGSEADRYAFWYDGQEDRLEADASADCDVYIDIDIDAD